jgi:hypothetical protein
MDEVYVSLLNSVSQKVVPHFYVFGSRVTHEIFSNINGTRAITHERYIGTLLTKVTSVYVIESSWKQQLAVVTYSSSVVD